MNLSQSLIKKSEWKHPPNFSQILNKSDFFQHIRVGSYAAGTATLMYRRAARYTIHKRFTPMLCDAHTQACMFDRAWVKAVHSLRRIACWEWGGCCFAIAELSFTLNSATVFQHHSKDVQCIFSNHVVFPVLVAHVYLTTAFTEQCVTVESGCQLCYFIVNFTFLCVFVCFIKLPQWHLITCKLLYIIVASWLSNNCRSLYHWH